MVSTLSFCHVASLLRLFCNLRLQMRVCLNKRWGLGKPNSDAETHKIIFHKIYQCMYPTTAISSNQTGILSSVFTGPLCMTQFSLVFSFLYFRYLFSSRTTDFGSPDKKEDFEWLIKWVLRFWLFLFQRLATQLHYRVYTVSCWSTQPVLWSAVWCLSLLNWGQTLLAVFEMWPIFGSLK